VAATALALAVSTTTGVAAEGAEVNHTGFRYTTHDGQVYVGKGHHVSTPSGKDLLANHGKLAQGTPEKPASVSRTDLVTPDGRGEVHVTETPSGNVSFIGKIG
jgi:hypothetical protein